MKVDEDFFEKTILITAIKNSQYFSSIVDYIDLKYFSNDSVLSVFRHVLNYYKEYNKKPSLSELKTVLTSPEDKTHFKKILESFKDVGVDFDFDILIKQTERYFREKAIISTMFAVTAEFKDLESAEIAERFQNACSISINTDIGFDYFKDLDEHIKYLTEEIHKISTGYKFFDSKLRGGFNKNGRALYLFMGGTNSCKSMLLGNLAANCVRQNLTVPIISLEMDEQLYAHRLSCNFSRMEFDGIKDDLERFKSSITELRKDNPDANLIFKEFPPGQLTLNELDSYLGMLKKSGKNFNIVFLDYITLMRSVGTTGLYESGKKLAEGVRALSYKYSVSFVSVIQANRSGVSGNQPKLDNTSESMGIAHTADFIASIWREEGDHETNTLRTGVVKNRVGENFGTQMLELDNYLRIQEVDSVFEDDSKLMNDAIKEQIQQFSNLEELLDE